MTTDQATAAITDLTGDYDIDPAHSRLGFAARHAMVTRQRERPVRQPASQLRRLRHREPE